MASEIPQFTGGWSYTQKEMTELFKHITYKDTYSILEFGSGESTTLLYNHFKKHVKNLTFLTYESHKEYLQETTPGFTYIFYNENAMDNVFIPSQLFDLILIDGPNGDKRALWYEKIRKCVKPGTIVLIDDFNHYKCFSDELDRNFHYDLLSHSDEPFVPYGEHSWKIVRIQSLKSI